MPKIDLTKVTLMLLAVTLCACSMKNEEIVRQTKYCHDHGMGVRVFTFDGGVAIKIECNPKEKF